MEKRIGWLGIIAISTFLSSSIVFADSVRDDMRAEINALKNRITPLETKLAEQEKSKISNHPLKNQHQLQISQMQLKEFLSRDLLTQLIIITSARQKIIPTSPVFLTITLTSLILMLLIYLYKRQSLLRIAQGFVPIYILEAMPSLLVLQVLEARRMNLICHKRMGKSLYQPVI